MTNTTDPGGRIDGRTARRDRNRLAVLDAVIELFGEGDLDPGVHAVADRSGVSLRSVYRYFEDIDELVSSAIDRQLTKLRPLFRIEGLGEGPLDERIERFVHRRVALFEGVRTVYLAATVRSGTDPLLREELSRSRDRLGEQSRAMFAPELDDLPEAEARHAALTLDVLGQLATLERLRHDLGLTVEETEAHLRDCISLVMSGVSAWV